MEKTEQIIQTLTHGELRIGDKLIDPINHEIKYPLRNDTTTLMFVTETTLNTMIKNEELRNAKS